MENKIQLSRILIVLTMVVALFSFLLGCSKEPQYEPIFNGKDYGGWRINCIDEDKSLEVFSIVDGELILDSKGTKDYVWLTYGKELTDFALRLKFIAYKESVGNCGIQFRDQYVDNKYSRHGFDLASNIPQSTGFIWDFTERWLPFPMKGYRSENFEPYLPEGWTYKWSTDPNPWNEFEVRVVGSHVSSILNGNTIIDWDGGDKINPTGNIAIEVHKGQVFRFRFKDIELADLSK